MQSKMKFIEINYHCHDEFTTPAEVIKKHSASNLFASVLSEKANIILVKHLDYSGNIFSDGISYQFFKRKNQFNQIPFPTHQFIKKVKPDIVLVQGFIFPLQVIFLRMKLGKHPVIMLQHHGEVPLRRKKIFQKIADWCVNAYLFASEGNAKDWLVAGIIRDRKKCYELPPASTTFSKKDKEKSRKQTGMTADLSFLWVGRLNGNKDPITVLRGFEKYFSVQPGASLYMIYSEDDMLDEIKDMIRQTDLLADRVKLIGKVANQELETWYSAADYFVSGSHREGGSYALMEAMACGCVPIVTNIPSAIKTIDAGRVGYYYEPGDSEGLYHVLNSLDSIKQKELSLMAKSHFKQHLSAKAIANRMYEICVNLKAK